MVTQPAGFSEVNYPLLRSGDETLVIG